MCSAAGGRGLSSQVAGVPPGALPGSPKTNRARTQKELDAAYKAQRGAADVLQAASAPAAGAAWARSELVPWALTTEGRKANRGGGQGTLAGGGKSESLLGSAAAGNPAAGNPAVERRRKQLTSDMDRTAGASALNAPGQNTLLGG